MKTNGLHFSFAAATALLLAACGGGGGGGGSTGGGGIVPTGPTPCPAGYTGTAPNCIAPQTTTQASGKLVDDPSGAPMGGIKVGLAPWTPAATPIPEGTTAPDGSFAFTAPNGHYLLVIGSDSSADTTRPTIHDNVTLTGGTQVLKAPVLPPIPTVTPPAAETNGNYRLTLIDQTRELPCFNNFNALRASHALPSTVVDEWLTENAREANQYHGSPAFAPGTPWPGNPWGWLTTGNTNGIGGNSCADFMPRFDGSDPYPVSLQTQWFAGSWYLSDPAKFFSGVSIIEYPRDPRAFTDPNVPVWP